MNSINKAIKILIIINILLVLVYFTILQTKPFKSLETISKQESVFNRQYTLKIINEHEVQRTHKEDTVRLYFENAYRLKGEVIVFIDK